MDPRDNTPLNGRLILALSMFGLAMGIATVFVIPSTPPRLIMLLTGPVVGLISGVVFGLFALVASKIIKPAKG